jgi:ketosteroid isomerase-like protein
MANDSEAIAQAQRAVWEAANRRDQRALEELVDEDFVLVEADTLERKGKKDFIREVTERSEEEDLLSFELTNVKVQVAGDMGVAYSQFHCEDEVEGERLSMSGNAVDVFVRRGGGWRLVGSVYGEVPPFTE